MIFEVTDVLEKMLELYRQPADFDRFKAYLKLLAGDTGKDLEVPVSGFNPMAKPHVLERLNELIELKAEQIAKDAIAGFNKQIADPGKDVIYKIFLNLSDDVKGGWTNRYTSDYDSKFRINGLVSRKFCTPVFWVSETYSEKMISQRILQYAYRTLYWLKHSRPQTLKAHIDQERFVAEQSKGGHQPDDFDFSAADRFYLEHQQTDDYSPIFNFLYGDRACESLAFPTFGVGENMTGYLYAEALTSDKGQRV